MPTPKEKLNLSSVYGEMKKEQTEEEVKEDSLRERVFKPWLEALTGSSVSEEPRPIDHYFYSRFNTPTFKGIFPMPIPIHDVDNVEFIHDTSLPWVNATAGLCSQLHEYRKPDRLRYPECNGFRAGALFVDEFSMSSLYVSPNYHFKLSDEAVKKFRGIVDKYIPLKEYEISTRHEFYNNAFKRGLFIISRQGYRGIYYNPFNYFNFQPNCLPNIQKLSYPIHGNDIFMDTSVFSKNISLQRAFDVEYKECIMQINMIKMRVGDDYSDCRYFTPLYELVKTGKCKDYKLVDYIDTAALMDTLKELLSESSPFMRQYFTPDELNECKSVDPMDIYSPTSQSYGFYYNHFGVAFDGNVFKPNYDEKTFNINRLLTITVSTSNKLYKHLYSVQYAEKMFNKRYDDYVWNESKHIIQKKLSYHYMKEIAEIPEVSDEGSELSYLRYTEYNGDSIPKVPINQLYGQTGVKEKQGPFSGDVINVYGPKSKRNRMKSFHTKK